MDGNVACLLPGKEHFYVQKKTKEEKLKKERNCCI